MKAVRSAEAKSRFSSILRDVEAGNEVAITSGKKNQAVAVIIPWEQWKKSKKRQLGTLEGKMTAQFADDWYMTDGELLDS